MQVILKSPSVCTEHQLITFAEMVEEGGEVASHGLKDRINNAFKLLFVMDHGLCVAVGALKNPSDTYKSAVFEKAGIQEFADRYQYEFGWVYVRHQFRNKGYGSVVVKAAMEYASTMGTGVFATTREDNHAIRSLNSKSGLTQIGSTYPSKHGDYFLVLYVNDATL
jgi:GNAT superfamily N-acetyltransferase